MQSENTSRDDARKSPKCAATQATSGNPSNLPEYSMRLSAKVEALIRNLNVEQTLTQHEDKALPVKGKHKSRIWLMSQTSRDLKN
jgi:hypothetical protein